MNLLLENGSNDNALLIYSMGGCGLMKSLSAQRG